MNAVRDVSVPGIPVGVRVVRNVEWLKWLGLVAMLTDHVGIYVFGVHAPIAEHIGALAFPLFAVALASGLCLRPQEYGWRVLSRMVGWACVAELSTWFVRGGFPLNVIFTLASGLLCHLTWAADWARGRRVVVLLAALVVGGLSEFSVVGVLFVWFLLEAMRSERYEWLGLPVVLVACLSPFNLGSHAALLVVPLVLLIALLRVDLPRERGFFYWAYVAQFPLLALAAALLRG